MSSQLVTIPRSMGYLRTFKQCPPPGSAAYVVLNRCHSSWLPVTSSVPQGSILGLLLFLAYINDLAKCPLSSGSNLLLFADDLLPSSTLVSDLCDFQSDVNAINQWSKNNHLTLNVSKTKYMLISRSRQHPPCPPIHLDGVPLEQVHHFKYLGVWISDDLTWSKHVSVSCKVHRYIFKTFSPHCSPLAIITLYKVQILPILDYGHIVWDPQFKKDSLLIATFCCQNGHQGLAC